jgi:hypothetical protein
VPARFVRHRDELENEIAEIRAGAPIARPAGLNLGRNLTDWLTVADVPIVGDEKGMFVPMTVMTIYDIAIVLGRGEEVVHLIGKGGANSAKYAIAVGDLKAEALLSPVEFAIATARPFDAHVTGEEALAKRRLPGGIGEGKRQPIDKWLNVALKAGNVGAVAKLVAAGFRGEYVLRICSSAWSRESAEARVVLAGESLPRVRRRVAELARPFQAEILRESLRRGDWRAEGARRLMLTGEEGGELMRDWLTAFGWSLEGAFEFVPSAALKDAIFRLGLWPGPGQARSGIMKELLKRCEDSALVEFVAGGGGRERSRCGAGGGGD